MTERLLADFVAWDAVMAKALEGVRKLKDRDPAKAARLGLVIAETGGAGIEIARDADGIAEILIARVPVWSGPLAEILRKPDA